MFQSRTMCHSRQYSSPNLNVSSERPRMTLAQRRRLRAVKALKRKNQSLETTETMMMKSGEQLCGNCHSSSVLSSSSTIWTSFASGQRNTLDWKRNFLDFKSTTSGFSPRPECRSNQISLLTPAMFMAARISQYMARTDLFLFGGSAPSVLIVEKQNISSAMNVFWVDIDANSGE